ncbi:MAG: patatin-like phospholipase family protein [Gammaproteobacteria bacterium]|nr:patatin-like phospholipase family protein [Gammaproteobacteria bacterium]
MSRWTSTIKRFLFIAVLLPALIQPLLATESRPRVGLVLSGGGARGAAHVGVLQALEDLRIPVDVVAGTSMGALVGGLYAAGKQPAELAALVETIDWDEVLSDKPARSRLSFRRKQDDRDFLIDFDLGVGADGLSLPRGLLQGQKLNLLLRSQTLAVTGTSDFSELPTPFSAVATNIETGEAVILNSGELPLAMRASMAVPGVFAPVEIDGQLLVDGGIANNMPIDVARAMGADIVIAVDVQYPLDNRDDLRSAVDITNQLITIVVMREAEKQLATLRADDILIVPPLSGIGSSAFERTVDAMRLGYEAAINDLQPRSSLALEPGAYQQYVAGRKAEREHPPIEYIIVEGDGRLESQVLAQRLGLATGPLDVAQLEAGIAELYGLDTFEIIDYRLQQQNGRYGLAIDATDKGWGPDYINLGTRLVDDLEGSSRYTIGLRYTRTAVNGLGAEWRSDVQVGTNPRLATEFYQPLDRGWRYFIAPSIALERFEVDSFSGEQRVADFFVTTASGQLDFGRAFGNWGELRLGLQRTTGRISRRTGLLEAPSSFDNGAFIAGFRVDTLDDASFPRRGWQSSLEWQGFRTDLGSRSNGDRIEIAASYALTRGKSTFRWSQRAGSNLDGDGELQNTFSLGGLFNLSGLRNGQLRGQHYAISDLVYYRRMEPAFTLPFYAGASLELGNTWERSSQISADNAIFAGSLFIGVDTFAGPLYLAWGVAEDGQSAAYFVLGPRFD